LFLEFISFTGKGNSKAVVIMSPSDVKQQFSTDSVMLTADKLAMVIKIRLCHPLRVLKKRTFLDRKKRAKYI